jgi:multiple antibiotic resistance protein
MITPAFIFTIFMLTLGPIKTVPAFFALTQDQPLAEARDLALKGTMAATAISLVIAVVMPAVISSWRISADDLRIAGGILCSSPRAKRSNNSAIPPQRQNALISD